MERKTSILILSGLLLASFFVPFIRWESFTMSGFDFVMSSYPPDIKYILLLVPVCALFLLVSALIDGTSIISSKLFLWTPLITLISLFILLFSNAENRIAFGSADPFKIFSLGFWVALAVSLILVVSIKRKYNVYKQYENPDAGVNWMN